MTPDTRTTLAYYDPTRKFSYVIAPLPAKWTLDLLEYALEREHGQETREDLPASDSE